VTTLHDRLRVLAGTWEMGPGDLNSAERAVYRACAHELREVLAMADTDPSDLAPVSERE